MTLSYLYKPGSATVGADGTTHIDVRPDTGQFWLPTLVHVSVRSGNQIWAALHAGSVAALSDNTTTKDFTFQGSNDTSSILCGTVVSPGEGISVVFTTGTPGDIAYVEVIGLSSDEPPTLGIIPINPGVRFIGASPSGTQRTLIIQQAGTPLAIGGTFISSPADLRNFQAFGFALDIQSTGNMSNFNGLYIQLLWTDDSTLARVVYEQHYEIFAADKNQIFGILGRLEYQDIVHGAFLTIVISTIAGPNALVFALDVFGSSRPMGSSYMRNRPSIISTPATFLNGGSTDWDDSCFVASATLGANANQSFIWPLAPGPASILIETSAAATTYTMTLSTTAGKPFYQQTAVPANAVQNIAVNFPLSAIMVNMKNNSATPGLILANASVVRQVG